MLIFFLNHIRDAKFGKNREWWSVGGQEECWTAQLLDYWTASMTGRETFAQNEHPEIRSYLPLNRTCGDIYLQQEVVFEIFNTLSLSEYKKHIFSF